MRKYDKIIIGFGKGGKTFAGFAGKKGEKVALIEMSDKMYGGTCINVACIPTKKLINNMRIKSYINAITEKNELISNLRQKNYNKISNLVDIIDAKASFVDKNHILLEYTNGETETIFGDTIIINTGATPIIPPIKGLKESKFMETSESIMAKETLPKNLVVIGAGYIGLEFSNMYKEFGTENVTVIERSDSILKREDSEIAARVLEDLKEKNIEFKFETSIEKIEDEKDYALITLSNGEVIKSDAILVVIGRRANTDLLKLENAGVETRENRSIIVNDTLQTNVENIYALGDVRGGLQFTYISMDDFRILKDNLYGSKTRRLSDRKNVPTSLFINPPLSSVGINEDEAKRLGLNYKVFKVEAATLPQAHVLNNKKGLMKAIVDADTDMILGATLYIVNSYEIINTISIAMDNKISYTYLRDKIFNHPTISETLNDLFTV
ncbi:FAD-dependent oxidoreductase [Oceanivirga miroungae]|uniref:Pyridine nucleotide-disulfide oxidoreductase dimerization protein n=1 Tax=Oceanivirga miroungae TaxID=1130046 RepID=A0A6I8M8F7_9FUSO|nr:FAD-dependent oxidoreductase [Oceanivirga miroungae]VWL85094.1 pyridine nucleotide-disulfide oxidoreductase dimerization protein [Oceanivirga miroungae]